MKTYLILIIFIAALMPAHLFAQGQYEDVIYLKNDSIYRGTIVEQIPNVSYRIEIAEGNVIPVLASDVQKIAKEPVAVTKGHTDRHTDEREDVIYLKNGAIYMGLMLEEVLGVSYKIEMTNGSVITVKASEIEKVTKESIAYIIDKYGDKVPYYKYKYPKPNPEVHYPDKGYFFEFQIHVEVVGGGIRMIHGYKINQYAMLGIGMGAGGVFVPVNDYAINGDISPFMGGYFPFFLYYSGDFLHKNRTAFYVLEAGYAYAHDPPEGPGDGSTYIRYNIINGGPMGSVGIGLRKYLRPKYVFTISLNLDIQYVHTDVYYYSWGYGYGTPSPPTNTYRNMVMLLPGLKLGFGLVK